MNRTPIEWTDFTWNPVTGCLRDCPYCYAKRIYHRFKRSFSPALHPARRDDPLKRKKPARIFVCSTADLFGPWVPDSWILDVVETAARARQHTFQFLTKYPARLKAFAFPSNAWVGTTVTDAGSAAVAAVAMRDVRATVRFASVEPMLGRAHIYRDLWIPDWIIIGRQTGPGAKPPPRGAAEELTAAAESLGVPVFHKPGLGAGFARRDFPGGEA